MLATILKAFSYSHDGITIRDLVKDAEENIREDLVDGLVAEKFIKPLIPGARKPAAKKPAAAGAPDVTAELQSALDVAKEKSAALREAATAARAAVDAAGLLSNKASLRAAAEEAERLADEADAAVDIAQSALDAVKE